MISSDGQGVLLPQRFSNSAPVLKGTSNTGWPSFFLSLIRATPMNEIRLPSEFHQVAPMASGASMDVEPMKNPKG
jgi:hypothetical protein